ncbi:MAG: N-acetylneuraminate synthase family protein [Treponema sp.]
MNTIFQAGGKAFQADKRILIIAEIGTSHNGDTHKAQELISAAKASGADAVKFQIVYADEILHPNTGFVDLPTGRIPLYERFKQLECPLEFYADLAQYARRQGMLFAASVFGTTSAQELQALNPAFIKIASPELNHFPLLKTVARCGKPIILSSGVSRLADIEKAFAALEQAGCPSERCALLHCITAYPAPETEYNTAVLQALSALFHCAVGISDHSLDPAAVPIAGMLSGASIIEKHICLSRSDKGLDDPVALEPAQFACMVQHVRTLESKSYADKLSYAATQGYAADFLQKIIGTGEKKLATSEKANYGKTNRSIHYRTALPAGTVIAPTDIALLRTEKNLNPGEAPEYMDYFIGAVLQKNVTSGAGAVFNDIIKR